MRLIFTILFIIFISAVANASPAEITFSLVEPVFIKHGLSKDLTVTVKNIGNTTDNYTMDIKADATVLWVNGEDDLRNIEIINLAPNATSSRTVAITLSENNTVPYNTARKVTVDVNSLLNLTEPEYSNTIKFEIPELDKLEIEEEFDPNDAINNLPITATGLLAGDNLEGNFFNLTYTVTEEKSLDICASGNSTGGDGSEKFIDFIINVENCSSDVEIVVNAITPNSVEGQPDVVVSDIIKGLYIVKDINITYSMFIVELFGFERPYGEIEIVKGNQTIRIKGEVRYDNGDPVGLLDQILGEITLTVTSENGTETNYTDGIALNASYVFTFPSPLNTSNYTLQLEVEGIYGINVIESSSLTVDNIVEYLARKGETREETLKKITIDSFSNTSINPNGRNKVGIVITNGNLFRVLGTPRISEQSNKEQFVIENLMVSSYAGSGSDTTYHAYITPKRYTKPGIYNFNVKYDSLYGVLTKTIGLRVLEEDTSVKENETQIKRYVTYGDISKISLFVTNTKNEKIKLVIREIIDKTIIEELIEAEIGTVDENPIENLISSCIDLYPQRILNEFDSMNFTSNVTVGSLIESCDALNETSACYLEVILRQKDCSLCAQYLPDVESCQLTCETENERIISRQQCYYDATVLKGECALCDTQLSNQLKPIGETILSFRELCGRFCIPRKERSNFSPVPKIIESDPVIEWEIELEPGVTRELSFTVEKLVADNVFSEPQIISEEIIIPQLRIETTKEEVEVEPEPEQIIEEIAPIVYTGSTFNLFLTITVIILVLLFGVLFIVAIVFAKRREILLWLKRQGYYDMLKGYGIAQALIEAGVIDEDWIAEAEEIEEIKAKEKELEKGEKKGKEGETEKEPAEEKDKAAQKETTKKKEQPKKEEPSKEKKKKADDEESATVEDIGGDYLSSL